MVMVDKEEKVYFKETKKLYNNKKYEIFIKHIK